MTGKKDRIEDGLRRALEIARGITASLEDKRATLMHVPDASELHKQRMIGARKIVREIEDEIDEL